MDTTNYLSQILKVIKRAENLRFSKEKTQFNNSEMRLIEEVVASKIRGERIISTQLAESLGVTRSAISQMVNKLEDRNIVKRVADKTDRKIAYIELSPEAEELYEKQQALCCESLAKVIEKMGTNKIDSFLSIANELFDTIEETK